MLLTLNIGGNLYSDMPECTTKNVSFFYQTVALVPTSKVQKPSFSYLLRHAEITEAFCRTRLSMKSLLTTHTPATWVQIIA